MTAVADLVSCHAGIEFDIGVGGRVKMAGGPVDVYYRLAEPMLSRGIAGAAETYDNYLGLRADPLAQLRAAFFPSVGRELTARLRGAGLYRHLRTDQGPGGNFAPFRYRPRAAGQQPRLHLAGETPHAILEESVRRQGLSDQLRDLARAVGAAYASGDLASTLGLLRSFGEAAGAHGVRLPDGGVGSRCGFFFVRPLEVPGCELQVDVSTEVRAALGAVAARAAAARHAIAVGMPYAAAVEQVRSGVAPSLDDGGSGLDAIYFQPDCYVDTAGRVAVDRINFPDVGLFLAELDAAGNAPLHAVQDIVRELSDQLARALADQLPGGAVTIVTKDDALARSQDTLELLEIRALTTLLTGAGYNVAVRGVSDLAGLDKQRTTLLLNPDVSAPAFARFTEFVVRNEVPAFPHPLLKTFEASATTLPSVTLTGKRLATLLALAKPKRIDVRHAARVHARLFQLLDKAGLDEDILHVSVPGLATPTPVFRYSLHSLMQVYNSVARAQRQGVKVDAITIRPVPFERSSAVFGDEHGKRLAAFRLTCTRRPH